MSISAPRSIDEIISEFLARISTLQPTPPIRAPIETFQGDLTWPDWAQSTGIYFFEQGGRVQYVGRALRTTLRQRLANQCNAFDDPKWDEVIKDKATVVGVLPLPDDQWYWAAALEALLIASLRPVHSKRIS